MRRAKDLLTRFLLTLALVVAAWPAQAGVETCSPAPRAKCAMPCCAKRAMADCMVASKSATKLAKPTCGCELRAIPPAPSSAKTLLSSEDHLGLSPPTGPSLDARTFAALNTKSLRFNAGPPPDPPLRDDASRAPPFVRA